MLLTSIRKHIRGVTDEYNFLFNLYCASCDDLFEAWKKMTFASFLTFVFNSIVVFVSSDFFAVVCVGLLSFGVVVLIPKIIYSIVEVR